MRKTMDTPTGPGPRAKNGDSNGSEAKNCAEDKNGDFKEVPKVVDTPTKAANETPTEAAK
jgi:hypothetical protein